jgi:hypothetical protein
MRQRNSIRAAKMRRLTTMILNDEEIAFRTEHPFARSGVERWFRVTK